MLPGRVKPAVSLLQLASPCPGLCSPDSAPQSALHSSSLRPDACADPTLKELTFEWKETENKQVKYIVYCIVISAGEREKAKKAERQVQGRGCNFQ